MTFNFAIPRAVYRDDPNPLRNLDGTVIPVLKKVQKMPRDTVGTLNRRHIYEKVETKPTNQFIGTRRVIGKYEHTYHATKGWRTRRVPS